MMYQLLAKVLVILIITLFHYPLFSQPTKIKPVSDVLSPEDIEVLEHKTMHKYNVPGMAVGIIKDNGIVFAEGFGVRNIHNQEKFNTEILFSIASTGKSSITASLALWVDAKKIHWNDKVIDYLSDFRLFDPLLTREFTILDLFVNNSGLSLGAGDLMHAISALTDFSFDLHDLDFKCVRNNSNKTSLK